MHDSCLHILGAMRVAAGCLSNCGERVGCATRARGRIRGVILGNCGARCGKCAGKPSNANRKQRRLTWKGTVPKSSQTRWHSREFRMNPARTNTNVIRAALNTQTPVEIRRLLPDQSTVSASHGMQTTLLAAHMHTRTAFLISPSHAMRDTVLRVLWSSMAFYH